MVDNIHVVRERRICAINGSFVSASISRSCNHRSIAQRYLRIGLLTLTTPLSGRFVTSRLGHAITDLPTKFEVSIFTRYGNMKGAAKC